jgi:hypothetical protein
MTETVGTQELPTIELQAAKLKDVIISTLGTLADELLGRPAYGTDEWLKIADALTRDKQAADQWTRDWHLAKIEISREAGIDPTGNVINAKRYGATWQAIADACGVSRQRAHDRWARLYNDIYPKG